MVMIIIYKHNPEKIMIMMITTTIMVGFHVVDYDFIYNKTSICESTAESIVVVAVVVLSTSILAVVVLTIVVLAIVVLAIVVGIVLTIVVLTIVLSIVIIGGITAASTVVGSPTKQIVEEPQNTDIKLFVNEYRISFQTQPSVTKLVAKVAKVRHDESKNLC